MQRVARRHQSALTYGVICLVLLSLLAVEQDPAFEPGASFRLYDIGVDMQTLQPLVQGQTPNMDVRIDAIDFATGTFPKEADVSGGAQLRTYEDHFLVEVICEINAPTSGLYKFRLTSDDGSNLSIDKNLVIDNDGIHGTKAVEGTINLNKGWHDLKIRMFENSSGEVLKLEWSQLGQEFEVLGGNAIRVPKGITRVVSPGRKRLYRPGGEMRPGNGMPLDALHPSYDLMTIRPEGFEPKVGAMAFLPDGRLLVTTFEPHNDGIFDANIRDGKIYLLDGVTGDDRSKITVKMVADGLKDPLGMTVVANKDSESGYSVYVSEQFQITEFIDTTGDDMFDTRKVVGNAWISDNFHHFTFGLAEKDGWLYASLSASFTGGAPGGNGPNPATRGTVFRVDPKRFDPNDTSANIEFLIGGLRTPNGIFKGSFGEIFVGENQGAWMPSNRLNHVVKGRFFGHYNNTEFKTAAFPESGVPALHHEQPLSQPALHIPQDEGGNSPGEGVLIPDGLFANQMLFTDVRYGGLTRAWVEEVDGEMQGGMVHFSQGFESGTHRLIWGPDGALYYGGIGATDTWAWVDPETGDWTQIGLQRLKPNGKTAFEIHSMVALPEGFLVKFTKPVSKTQLEDLKNHHIEQWHYAPTPEYGGTKRHLEQLPVSQAIASSDNMSVRLIVPGLKADRVVKLRSSVESSEGEQLWAAECWYTLNNIPGQTDSGLDVLVFSKTTGFRHGSIDSGKTMFKRLAGQRNWNLTITEDAEVFASHALAGFDVVVFLSTTGDPLNDDQQKGFEAWYRKGGGYVGIHAAADTEYEWEWYGDMVGGYFLSHPQIQEASIVMEDRGHPATIFLPDRWKRTDEWYDYRINPRSKVQVLGRLDTATYEGHKMGADHPIVWCQEFDGGRSFYTGLGHTNASYTEPKFVEMIKKSVQWAAFLRD